MMWRDFVNSYFTLSSKERKGSIFILSIILITVVLPLFFNLFVKEKHYDQKEFEAAIALLKIKKNDSADFEKKLFKTKNYSTSQSEKSIAHEEFYFDPNTASSEEWKKLGIRDKTIQTIHNYVSKGGRFYKPEDLAKIWGISPADRNRLIPYVRITKTVPSYVAQRQPEYASNKNISSLKTLQKLDINLADTNAYVSLPGIGSKLSQRIVAFREKLGGFYSIEQVGETYLLPDSTFQKIKKQLVAGNIPVRKININTATVDEMKTHPYLRYNIANAIVQYRQQHGAFAAVEDIKKILLVSEEIFPKVSPYLSLE